MQGNTILSQIVSVFNIRGSSYCLILDSCLFLFKLCFLGMSWILLLKGTRNGGGGGRHIFICHYIWAKLVRCHVFVLGVSNLFNAATFHWSSCPKPGKWATMCLCVRVSILLLDFATVPTGWYCFVFHFIICITLCFQNS